MRGMLLLFCQPDNVCMQVVWHTNCMVDCKHERIFKRLEFRPTMQSRTVVAVKRQLVVLCFARNVPCLSGMSGFSGLSDLSGLSGCYGRYGRFDYLVSWFV